MNERYKQPSAALTRKVAAGGAGVLGMSGLVALLKWVGQQVGVELPDDAWIWIASGILGSIGGGWAVTERKQGA